MFKKYLIVFLVSMVPLVELRGAIPWSQAYQLPLLQSYIVCVIGNMIPVPIIYLFARKVLEWGCDKKYIGKFLHLCRKDIKVERSLRKRLVTDYFLPYCFL